MLLVLWSKASAMEREPKGDPLTINWRRRPTWTCENSVFWYKYTDKHWQWIILQSIVTGVQQQAVGHSWSPPWHWSVTWREMCRAARFNAVQFFWSNNKICIRLRLLMLIYSDAGGGVTGGRVKTQFDVRYFAEHTPAPDTRQKAGCSVWCRCLDLCQDYRILGSYAVTTTPGHTPTGPAFLLYLRVTKISTSNIDKIVLWSTRAPDTCQCFPALPKN